MSWSDHLLFKMTIGCYGRVLLFAILALSNSQVRAASVSGRAARADRSVPLGPCHATLRAELDRRGAPDPDIETPADGKTTFSVPMDQSGTFQFISVPPGKYLLAVECPTASAVHELKVESGKDIRIDPPLLLEDLTLAISIIPRLDPEGQPWQLSVDATMPRLRLIAHKTNLSEDGTWARRGLNTGNYRITVSSSDGKPWLQQFFNLSAKSRQLRLQLPVIRVEGLVRLGWQPLHADLVFHNEAGGEPRRLSSDDNGFFQGLLPITPGTQEARWTVEARCDNPPISRRLVGISTRVSGESTGWLDLTLPAFALHGTVVSETGEPQAGAQVTLKTLSSGEETSTASNDSGAFELQDLPPGKYTAVAESIDGVSEHTPLQVLENREGELRLVLQPSAGIPFYVVSREGPVANASVEVWIQPGVPRYFTHTNNEGRFEVKLPPGTTEVGLTIGAAGYPLKLARVQVLRDGEKSSGATTINLGTSGGTLILNLQPPKSRDVSATPYLIHNGAIEAAGTLITLGANQPELTGGGPIVSETVEPGVYSLCMVVNPSELTAYWFGARPSNRCRTESLDEGGELILSSP